MKSIDTLRILYQRFVNKSPKAYKVVTNILMVAAFIVGLPELLHQFDIDLPGRLDSYLAKAVSFSALVIAFATKLTVDDKTVLKK
jgi:hypothetical protein